VRFYYRENSLRKYLIRYFKLGKICRAFFIGKEMEYEDPYLVVGTGRCGTSTVARILHEKFGICMGYAFFPANQQNSQGYYEDAEFSQLNYLLLRQGMKLQDWFNYVLRLIHVRQVQEKPWGIKDPRMADIFGLYLSFFENPRIIRCRRDMDGVIGSLKRSYGYDEQRCRNLYWIRTKVLDRLLLNRDHLDLDFTTFVPDEQVEEKIKAKWSLILPAI